MDALQPGDPGQVGHYRLIGRLGEGGMGRVYLGLSPAGWCSSMAATSNSGDALVWEMKWLSPAAVQS